MTLLVCVKKWGPWIVDVYDSLLFFVPLSLNNVQNEKQTKHTKEKIPFLVNEETPTSTTKKQKNCNED